MGSPEWPTREDIDAWEVEHQPPELEIIALRAENEAEGVALAPLLAAWQEDTANHGASLSTPELVKWALCLRAENERLKNDMAKSWWGEVYPELQQVRAENGLLREALGHRVLRCQYRSNRGYDTCEDNCTKDYRYQERCPDWLTLMRSSLTAAEVERVKGLEQDNKTLTEDLRRRQEAHVETVVRSTRRKREIEKLEQENERLGETYSHLRDAVWENLYCGEEAPGKCLVRNCSGKWLCDKLVEAATLAEATP